MPRYRRRRRATDPVRGLIIDLLALFLGVLFFFGIFGILSQPSAFKFTFGAAPTPTPVAQASINTSPAGGWIVALACMALLIGGAGLITLGVVWLALRLIRKSSAVPVTPGIGLGNETQPVKMEMETRTSEIQMDAGNAAPTAPEALTIAAAPPTVQTASVMAPHEPDLDVEAHSLISGFERSFFWALRQAVQDDYYIFPQVPLRELVQTNGRSSIPRELNGMFYKGVVDFLLADPTTIDAALALEFDDPSHRQADAQARDRRKGIFLQKVGLPLTRFHSGGKWNVDLLRQQIQEGIAPHCRVPFLQDKEREFFRLLREARPDLFIFPKVPLNQLIHRKGWLSTDSFKTLENETVDFLLAHPRYLGTLLVFELNDSHQPDKTNLLDQAQIKWLCLDGARLPTVVELRAKIARPLQRSTL